MKFTGKDFLNFNDKVIPGEKDSLDCIADIANAKLEQWLKELQGEYEFYQQRRYIMEFIQRGKK